MPYTVCSAAMLLLPVNQLVAAATEFTIGLRALVLTTDQDAEQVDLPRKVLAGYSHESFSEQLSFGSAQFVKALTPLFMIAAYGDMIR